MTRKTFLILVFGFLTVAWVAEVSAQTPSVSSTRRSSLLNASLVNMFGSDGGLNTDRALLKSESLADNRNNGDNRNSGNGDRMMAMLQSNDLATMLNNPNVSNMNVFLTYSGALQRVMGLDPTTTTPAGDVGGLLISSIDTADANLLQTNATTGRRGLYPPRLRFWPNAEDLAELQKPEVQAELEEADRERAAELVADLSDKFDLPATSIALEFHGLTAVIQGRVPNPTVRKQLEMYLGFEPGIYSVQNHLVVDPDMGAVELPTTHNDPAP